jgi:hypothetical protein
MSEVSCTFQKRCCQWSIFRVKSCLPSTEHMQNTGSQPGTQPTLIRAELQTPPAGSARMLEGAMSKADHGIVVLS